MSTTDAVLQLLRLYEGHHPREGFKPPSLDASQPVVPRDHSRNPWITEDPKNGRWLIFRSQVPEHLEPAYDLALAEGLLEQYLLTPGQQLDLYRSTGAYRIEQNRRWTTFPGWSDALVEITDRGRAALVAGTDQPLSKVTESSEVPADGTIRDSHIRLKGKDYLLTEGLRGLLAFLLAHPGVAADAVVRQCGYTDSSHLHKRLKDLRFRLQKELKGSGWLLQIKTRDTRIYWTWIQTLKR